jgi:hypothetical protein
MALAACKPNYQNSAMVLAPSKLILVVIFFTHYCLAMAAYRVLAATSQTKALLVAMVLA